MTFPYLTTVVLLPAGAALLVALVPRSRPKVIQGLGMVASVAVGSLAVALAVHFRVGEPGFQMVSRHTWIRSFGISWNLGVDGISLFLVLLCGILFPVTLAGARVRRDPKAFVAWMLLLETACLGSFLSLDLLFFFLFFELSLVPTYFIIGGWGFSRRGYAAIKFFLYTFLGSAFLLIGLLAVVFIHQRHSGSLTFDLTALSSQQYSSVVGIVLLLAFTAAFAVKAPIFPLHTWSPDAYTKAPAGGSVILAAVMAKLGTYGIVRFDFQLFPKAAVTLAPVLLTLAVIGIIYGAVVAAAQKDLKRLVAYSSLAHLGFIVLGTFAFTNQGISGGVLQMLNHGLYTAALFLLVGMIYERRRTWQIPDLHGLQRPAPIMAGVFTLVMMASIGLPGLNGFVGEFLILIGTFVTHRWWAVVGTAGVILAAVYLLWAYQQIFHGRPRGDNALFREMTWKEGAVMAPLVMAIVFIGVYPRPLLDRITPSVNALVHHIDVGSGKHYPVVATQSSRPAGTTSALGGAR
ncbi:MAG: Fe-S-binding domain-containing protein [Acidimicrobiales bacterium]|nr:MAG: Fe-S-binding domain-containing protein [Acidimicrobiales bacterium]